MRSESRNHKHVPKLRFVHNTLAQDLEHQRHRTRIQAETNRPAIQIITLLHSTLARSGTPMTRSETALPHIKIMSSTSNILLYRLNIHAIALLSSFACVQKIATCLLVIISNMFVTQIPKSLTSISLRDSSLDFWDGCTDLAEWNYKASIFPGNFVGESSVKLR